MVLSRLLRAGEGKMLKRLRNIASTSTPSRTTVVDLTDAELRAKTEEFRKRYADGETLDELLPEAFAVVREARQAHPRPAALRRPADGRRRAAPRARRRDEDR